MFLDNLNDLNDLNDASSNEKTVLLFVIAENETDEGELTKRLLNNKIQSYRMTITDKRCTVYKSGDKKRGRIKLKTAIEEMTKWKKDATKNLIVLSGEMGNLQPETYEKAMLFIRTWLAKKASLVRHQKRDAKPPNPWKNKNNLNLNLNISRKEREMSDKAILMRAHLEEQGLIGEKLKKRRLTSEEIIRRHADGTLEETLEKLKREEKEDLGIFDLGAKKIKESDKKIEELVEDSLKKG